MKKVLLAVLLLPPLLFAAEAVIALSAPEKTGGKGLFEALNYRKSVRNFSEAPLTPQQLSQLLWCANGFSAWKKRTAPSAVNRQEIDIYCLLPEGAYFYDAVEHQLILKCAKDLRSAIGNRQAPCYLVLVADAKRQYNAHFAVLDCGYVSQNIYLFCQSAGLGTCAMGKINDRETLCRELELGDSQLLLVHPVGIPK